MLISRKVSGPARALVAALLLAPMLALASSPASAEPTESTGELLVILDVSGSMARKDADGTTLMRGARQAVAALLDGVPETSPVGLRLYGADYAGDNERQGCRDTGLAVPIGPVDETGGAIEAAVESASPTGFTPIGYSLREAAGDFSPQGPRSIVLISDGEDTCGAPEPCQAARDLSKQGIDVRIDTVGLLLAGNKAARRQLACVARVTGGEFVTADDAKELTRQLEASADRATRRFETSGTRVEGGTAITQAAPVTVGETYADDVTGGEARWYSFEGVEGQVVRARITEDGRTEYGCCLAAQLRDPSDGQIDFDNGFNRDGVATTFQLESFDDGLRTSGTHYLVVEVDAGATTTPISYDFVIEVVGDASAAPTPTADPSAGPDDADETTSPGDSTGEVDQAAADDGSGVPAWAVALIAVLTVVVLGLGAAIIVLLRRTSGAPHRS
ncbi:VWA domain-containing protein [Nocardioides sp. R-C-SC26]|uniref:VWA domain-containing protein n=1 Tax=Nocardioides sp. R-C-SC26 TaxID=2870414 RepID=UPI001E3F6A05|nr:VWA domain-containing protein [Nocardioides sp. R-C-SC26]